MLEERVGTSTTANKQFVYHPHYVDAIALRRDASGTDHYYLQDANFNVTAVTDNTGAVIERYAYTRTGKSPSSMLIFQPIQTTKVTLVTSICILVGGSTQRPGCS